MHLRSLFLLLIILIGMCISPVMGGKVAPDKDLALNEAQLKLSTDLLQLTNSTYLPAELTRQELVSQLKDQGAYQASGQTVRGVGASAPSELVYVYVTLSQGTPLSSVDPYVWRVRNSDESWRTVAAWVEVSRLLALASVPGVTGIRTVLPPVTRSGTVTAESDNLQLADQVRTQYGLTGAGIKIGVISDGVDSWNTALASGNLPANLHVLSNSVGGDEGTAMLEIVYDIAPGAELYFHDCGENTIAFNAGVDDLVNAGCTVIVDDIGWPGEPFFQDGLVASHVQSVASTGNVLYISSAGNDAEDHYQGMFANDGQNFHNQYLYVAIPPGGSIMPELQWDDTWGASSNDYDLVLWDPTDYDSGPLYVSEFEQNGDDDPEEFIPRLTNTGSSPFVVELDVYNYQGTAASRTLEIFLNSRGGACVYSDDTIPDVSVPADSVCGHPAATNVVAVGAIDAEDSGTDTIESFSSLGPVTIRGAAQRQKPDVTGIDGVSVTGVGGFGSPFYGTSASAPGVAAVAALVWSGAPTKTATEVRTALLSSCVDLGASGRDTTFGEGRVNALAFADLLVEPAGPTVTSITPNAGAPGATVAITDLAGTGFQSGATVKLQRQGSTDIQATNVIVASATKITCQFALPANAATGAWNVVVTSGGQSATLAGGFTVSSAPPTAAFQATPTSGPAQLAVQFTDQSTGAPTSWSWTFGDGGTSALQNPTHTYTAAGTYTVNLTVTSAGGSDDEKKTDYITVTPPPVPAPVAGFSADVTTGFKPLTVQFTDASTGTGITARSWTFGDGGTSTETSPVHTYTAAGTYTVNLTVTNAGGSDDEKKINYITVDQPPTDELQAGFSANATSGVRPLTVLFTDASTGTGITARSWTFGDGGTSSEQSPVHTYTAAGTYTVNLTVTNATAADSEEKTDYITVSEPLPGMPTAAFGANVTTGLKPLTVQFADASTGEGITAWSWTFGDGGISSEQSPVHTYTAAGTYTVNLTVTNASGSDDERKVGYISVGEEVLGPQKPYPAPHIPETVIQAEHFDYGGEGVAYHDLEPANLGNNNMRSGEGVDIETDGGVTNVAYIRSGEYLKYSVDTTAAGSFYLKLRAANPDATAKAVRVYLDGAPTGEVLVAGTGSWTTYKEFSGATPLVIPQGRHVVTLAFEGIDRINLDWLSVAAGIIPPAAAPMSQTVPYGPGNTIPGRVQAENFDKNGADAACYDLSAQNEGGAYRVSEPVDIEYTPSEASYNVGWIRTGEWLIYTVTVASPGTYTASFRAANPDASNKAIDVYVDGVKVDTALIGATGSFGTFGTFTLPVTLPAGTHQLKLVFASQRLNLNYVEFTNGGVVTTTTVPSNGASFVAAPLTAQAGTGVKFTVTPASGKTVSTARWSFDAPAHLNTWNSNVVNPTFYYPARGTYSPYVKLTYSDGTTEIVQKANYITAL